jgi:hypothetical protein
MNEQVCGRGWVVALRETVVFSLTTTETLGGVTLESSKFAYSGVRLLTVLVSDTDCVELGVLLILLILISSAGFNVLLGLVAVVFTAPLSIIFIYI